MLASKLARELYCFGPFRLDPAAGQLLSDGKPIPLEPKPFQTLLLLVRNCGRLVEKDELMREIWPDQFVEENNLARNISILRKTLGKDQDGNQYIETAARRGYRFVGKVRQVEDPESNGRDVADVADFAAARQTQYRTAFGQAESRNLGVPSIGMTEAVQARKSCRVLMLIAAPLVLAAAMAGAFFVQRNRRMRVPAAGVKSMAILPFKTSSGEGLNDYVGLGLSDALATKLGRLQAIVVRPASTAQRAANGQKESVAAGRELGVEAVLDGRIETIGSRIRVTTRLIDVRDERVLWTGTVDEDSSTAWRLEDTIADNSSGRWRLA